MWAASYFLWSENASDSRRLGEPRANSEGIEQVLGRDKTGCVRFPEHLHAPKSHNSNPLLGHSGRAVCTTSKWPRNDY